MHIYMALEGRRYWPKWLRNWCQHSEEKRLKKYLEEYNQVKVKEDNQAARVKYLELSVELRRFPLDYKGNPNVNYPTRLGNLLSAYEDYPLRSYGMDSFFYWYRIWLAIDEDLREHIDTQQALADSSVYMTVALFFTALILTAYALIQQMGIRLITPFPTSKLLLFSAFFSMFLSWLLYRASLHLHATFGELYKSMFDMHRDKVSVDDVIDRVYFLTKDESIKNASSSEKYIIAWRYLHNYKIKTKDGVVSVATLDSD
ncbi:MAG: hypothetical protein D3908_14900 [Candidatus Electrothrix sp. AUS4]|nr:hypothetical protein [Candidatus Electrothrix sp. AUS4]